MELDDMISAHQEAKHNFIQQQQQPKHVTMIIGIDENMQYECCRAMKLNPIFRSLESFAYLVPTTFTVPIGDVEGELNSGTSPLEIAEERAV